MTEPGRPLERQDSPESDEALMLAFRQGEVGAFDELFRRYERAIWGYFRRRLGDPDRAAELTQETFLAVVKAAPRYEARATFRTYLYGIAWHLLSADRRAARPAPGLTGAGERGAPPSIDDDLWMREAVARLDELDRAVVMLREFESLSYAEIAVVLKIPVNTVRSRLFRAREALRRLLRPEPLAKGRAS